MIFKVPSSPNHSAVPLVFCEEFPGPGRPEGRGRCLRRPSARSRCAHVRGCVHRLRGSLSSPWGITGAFFQPSKHLSASRSGLCGRSPENKQKGAHSGGAVPA